MHLLKKLFIVTMISNALTSNVFASQLACPEFPYFKPQSGSAAILNCSFHQQYEKRLQQIKSTLGITDGIPVILNLGGNLEFKYHGNTEKPIIQPDAYHIIKAFSHISFSIFLILTQNPLETLNEDTITSLQLLSKEIIKAKSELPRMPLANDAYLACKRLLEDTLNFLQVILAAKHVTDKERMAYYAQLKPQLETTNKLASQIELTLLDQAVDRFLLQLNNKEKAQLAIVVAVSHQARAQEISLQYFAKKFSKTFGEGALNENGLVVLEDKFDEDSALTLLAKHYLDRQAAKMIFNHAEILQRDVLAFATKNILKQKR